MIQSRFTRCLGFGLCLLAALLSSLASGAALILCVEPDGCVELEFVASGAWPSVPCAGHECEQGRPQRDAPDPTPPDSQELQQQECPCTDTVIASFSDTLRPEKGDGSRIQRPRMEQRESLVVAAPSSRLASLQARDVAVRLSTSVVDHGARYSQRSVVLLI